MAAPNIVNVTNIAAQTAVLATTSTYANLVVNASGTNAVVKVNVITIANYSPANFTANVDIFRSSTSYPIIGNVTIPANSTMIVSGKDTSFYLQEGDVVRASTSNASTAIASFEIIS